MVTNDMRNIGHFENGSNYNKVVKTITSTSYNNTYVNSKIPTLYYISAANRIYELAVAISSNVCDILSQRHNINKWAEEIEEICNMVDYLTDDEDEDE